MSSRKRHLLALLLTATLSGPLLWLMLHHLPNPAPFPTASRPVPVSLAEIQTAPPPAVPPIPPKTPPEQAPRAPATRPEPASPTPPPSPEITVSPTPSPTARPAVSEPDRAHAPSRPVMKPTPRPTPPQQAAPRPNRPVPPTPPRDSTAAPAQPMTMPPPSPSEDAATADTPPSPDTDESSPRTPPRETDPHILDAYLQALRQHIARLAQSHYPYRARRLGQEGVVRLHFVIRADGRIEAVTLAQSSGFPLLDEAALAVIEDAMQRRFRPFPEGLHRDQLTITAPIHYRLQ